MNTALLVLRIIPGLLLMGRGLHAVRRVARHGERRCDHLHDTVSRYDHAAKRLELLLTCSVCETEKLIHSLAYEPRFEPSVASVHALHPREGAAVGRARPRSVGGTARLRGCAVIERRDGTCELPIAAAEIPVDGTDLTFLESDAEACSFTFGQSGDGDG